MTDLFEGLTVRPPTTGDAEAVHALISAREIFNHGVPDETLDDVIAEWKDLKLEEDAWLVYSHNEKLIGYAAVFEEREGYILLWYAHPEYDDHNLAAELLEKCEQRAHEKLADSDIREEARLWMFIVETDRADRNIVEAVGFEPYKYYFRMQVNSRQEPPPPIWPKDTRLRTITPGEDDQSVYDFIYAQFDWEGRRGNPTFEEWRDFMMREDHFKPELWYLLEQNDEIIAAALCYEYPEYGWVRQLAVKEDLRRNGIGAEMLRHVFSIFWQRNKPNVALVVDSTNPKAQDFYINVGMYQERQHIEYEKTIS